ncbi:MAG: aminopeptidase N [Paraglaciecola sp.]|jgi:aminopeptidase N
MKKIYPFLFLIFLIQACQTEEQMDITSTESGIPKILADHRKATISNINYNLFFDIPKEKSIPIIGTEKLTFDLSTDTANVVLDFDVPAENVKSIAKNGSSLLIYFENGHLTIPKHHLTIGKNEFTIEFIAGEKALNRNEEFLYTLFVPANAHTAFPCFDQPNLKATYELSLSIPKDWKAVANYNIKKEADDGEKTIFDYNKTAPISTYLFAFVVGKFELETATVNGHLMNMYHRETDAEKIKRNTPEIFDLHAKSLDWLVNYTKIEVPFQKFDFVLIPAFQFGGMEHPGAIAYKSRSLMLEKTATESKRLSRNSLIAHETAHFWFGDLVTMDWFNDVWLKEVFANFMAAKMVNPNFPEINHDLRFLLRHYPAAYSEDRSEGTHPIQQQLDNLKDAGTLYGRLIYEKSPIVMKQLELILGEENFQNGMQEYLKKFSFDNATWDDLIAILDEKTPRDLAKWSNTWVKEAEMPHVEVDLRRDGGKITSLQLIQRNATATMNLWDQDLEVLMVKNGKTTNFSVNLDNRSLTMTETRDLPAPDYLIPNGKGIGYGYFELDDESLSYLANNVQNIEDDYHKSVVWLSLWEAFLRQKIDPATMLIMLENDLPKERESLGLDSRLDYLKTVFWGFISPEKRKEIALKWETLIWDLMEETTQQSQKKALLDTYISIALSNRGVQKLRQLWQGDWEIKDLELSKSDRTKLAYELAVRDVKDASEILALQLSRLENPDRKLEMSFVIPALSDDAEERDAFFETLKNKDNRNHESWVLQALEYLHHPLRAKNSERYILPSLELMEEIQVTGDIFFPRRWISVTLAGYQSKVAGQTVRDFLAARPDYNFRLKNKILMGADMLFRKGKVE